MRETPVARWMEGWRSFLRSRRRGGLRPGESRHVLGHGASVLAMRLSVHRDGTVEAHVKGVLDAGTVAMLRERFLRLHRRILRLELHLDRVERVDTVGVAGIVAAARDLRRSGAELRLHGVPEAARTDFELSAPGLLPILESGVGARRSTRSSPGGKAACTGQRRRSTGSLPVTARPGSCPPATPAARSAPP